MTAEPLPLDRIHDLAANYSDRQGLRIVPLAIALFAQSLPLPHQYAIGADPLLLTLIVGLGGYYLVGRYYEHRFGKVEELPYEGVPVALQIFLVLFCLIPSIGVDVLGKPPVFVSGLLIAGWLIVTAWPSRRIRSQYLSIGIMLAIVSLTPLIGESRRTVGLMYGAVFGAMLLMAGVRDHIEFVRLFPPMEPQHE